MHVIITIQKYVILPLYLCFGYMGSKIQFSIVTPIHSNSHEATMNSPLLEPGNSQHPTEA